MKSPAFVASFKSGDKTFSHLCHIIAIRYHFQFRNDRDMKLNALLALAFAAGAIAVPVASTISKKTFTQIMTPMLVADFE